MSAANASAQATSLEEEMRAHEPSMEEILASIRRIIADDDGLPGVRRERDNQRRPREVEEPALAADAPSAQSAYPAPALERRDPPVAVRVEEASAEQTAVESVAEPAPAPVAEIRPLRINRVAEEAMSAEAADDRAAEADAVGSYPNSGLDADDFVAVEADAPLISSDAASSISTHFQALAASMIINDSGLLQKYAQEMMRPMLKQWLDDNLPVIVERLVRAEIERVARGGRR